MVDHTEPGGRIVEGPLHNIFGEQALSHTLKLPGIPASWNFYLLSIGAMLALSGLDFAGSVFAKEWTLRHHSGLFLAGLATFAVLFCVFALSLKVAELSIVAFGWIIFLQIGLLLLDRYRYGVDLPRGKWVAIAIILALQAYLMLAPNGTARESIADASTPPAVHS